MYGAVGLSTNDPKPKEKLVVMELMSRAMSPAIDCSVVKSSSIEAEKSIKK
jgi:hypothetical protein